MNFDAKNLDFGAMHDWELYSKSLDTELRQCLDEGRDVAQYADLCAAIRALPLGEAREELAHVFFKIMMDAPRRADYPYEEPDDLIAIRAARPAEREAFAPPAHDGRLEDKIRGAWLGRICGCLLGKPVEGMRTPDLHELLRRSGNFPLARYMTREDLKKTPRLLERWDGRAWADALDGCAPADDDTNYTVMAAVGIVGKYGRGFTSDDVAAAWVDCQPKRAYCTAERRAFRNFVIGIRPPRSAVYKNPDREFIGAQIRGDYFGYINPGDPETAAEMAWRDARVSHVKNGIYGEMFAAAMLAAAAVTDDVRAVIRAGLQEIPANCRLSEGVGAVCADFEAGLDEAACFAHIAGRWDEFKAYDWVHTVSNAEIVAASLLYGGGDYGRSVCRAVQTGFDTDCNGATVGSIVGMMRGSAAVGAAWTAPICGMLDTAIFGVGRVSVEDMVSLTMRHLPGRA
ncbi:MAG: ADP-ribosylglycohydrolase family protein [Clostridia bacterium]|nr:ADP-ribosylglycohydrolase family protein [Clostridia bacterium]